MADIRDSGTAASPMAREVMREELPEGAPPSPRVFHKSVVFLVTLVAIVFIGGGVLATLVGGMAGLIFVLVVAVLYGILAAAPVWGSGLFRKHEQDAVKHAVDGGPAGPPYAG